MRTSHHYSRLEVQTYDCAFHNGNLHIFNSAGGNCTGALLGNYQYLQLEIQILPLLYYNMAVHKKITKQLSERSLKIKKGGEVYEKTDINCLNCSYFMRYGRV